MSIKSRHGAFTLTELLVVIAIVFILLGILLPVLASVRAKSRETVCTSNLHQLGHAMLMYAEDYDNAFPYGGDPTDLYDDDLGAIPGGGTVVSLRPLTTIMAPYIGDRQVWHCPADTGLTMTGFAEDWPYDTRPSSFDRFGSSYYYFIELAIGHYHVSDVYGLEGASPHEEHNGSEIIVLSDGTGLWHGGGLLPGSAQRYGCLFVDGHAKTLPIADYQAAYDITLHH